MWFRRLSHYLLDHPLTALLVVFLLTGSTLVDASKSMLLVFLLMLGGAFALTFSGLVTLLRGEKIGACFMGAATLPYVLKLGIALVAHQASLDWMLVVGVTFSCLLNACIWAVASLLRRGYSFSTLMQSMTLFGVFALCLIFVAYPGLTQWWITVLQKPVELAQLQATAVSGQPVVEPAMQAQLIESMARIATGVMIASLIFCVLIQVMMSRWWQGFLTAPGLLKKELSEIRLSRLTGMLFALGVIISSLGSYYPEFNNDLITAIMPIAYALFLMAGFNLVHYFFGFIAPKARLFWMLFFYIFFIYMAPFSLVLVAMIALFDIWLDLRKRFPSV